MGIAKFQSTHPRGVRHPSWMLRRSCWPCFNPRTRVGCDALWTQKRLRKWPSFNPRTRVGCDFPPSEGMRRYIGFQSTHPRGVRPAVRQGLAFGRHVSIHAPAWGATGRPRAIGVWEQKVSIHAPAWGATDAQLPRVDQVRVSIHAPAWGATMTVRLPTGPSWSFNPRTRVGCDALWTQKRLRKWPSFNPRTRVGCDFPPSEGMRRYIGFQSTHPRGVRLHRFSQTSRQVRVSIHAPAWGATVVRGHGLLSHLVSIHAPAWGATVG